MIETFSLLTFFIAVTVCQALAIIFVKSHKSRELIVRIWPIHYWVNGLLWILFAVWIILINVMSGDVVFPVFLQLVGLALCIFGLLLSADGLRRIGLKQVMGYRFFCSDNLKWTSSGSYSMLNNPIYDGFVLVFLGLGLFRGLYLDFYLAAASILLLNVFLATVENDDTKSKGLRR